MPEKRMKRKTFYIVIASLVALGVLGYVTRNIEANRIEAAAQAEKASKLRLIQEKRDALIAEFVTNKSTLLSNAQRLIAQGEPTVARALLIKFTMLQDQDVNHLLALADKNLRIAQNIKQLSDELANKPDKLRSMVIYTELAALDSSNPLWRALIEENKPIVDALKAQQAKAEITAARKEAIKRLLSGWDGSVQSVEEAIKLRLKDPDSYKHVETKLVDSGFGNVTVFTKYRARNSFNAVITDTATAVVSPTGELVSLNLKN